MSSLFSKTLVYLGLVDEDQLDAQAADSVAPVGVDDPTGNSVEPINQERRVEPPPTARAATRPRMRGEALDPVVAVRPVEAHTDILVIEEFGDARILADRVRDRTPVVLDMRRAEPELVRRVVDFSSGLIYALDGSMRRVGDGLVLVLPPRVTLSRDEKRRLTALGAYELDDVND